MIEVLSPYDRSKIGELRKSTEQEVESMLSSALAVFNDRKKWLTITQRTEILQKLADLVSQHAEEFAALIAKEGGKPLADAKVEVARAIDGIKLAPKELINVMKGVEIPMGYTKASEGRRAHTIMEPIGVVVAISAFNHPLNLIVHQAVPAIAIGAPVIIKPDSKTPLSCKKFVELVHQAGLPKEWCHFCVTERSLSEKLACDPRVSFLTFIGSAKVGWMLRSKVAPGTRISLEHGGAAPAIVDKHIDNIDEVIKSMVKGGFYHAGQVCISTQRIYVHESMVDEFNNKLVKAVNALKVGDPSDIKTEVGPLISTNDVNRMAEWVQEAIDSGAKVLCGGEKISDTLYKPTVLFKPSAEAKVTTHEIFGPIVCVYTYSTLDEAVKLANTTDFPFQSAIYSNNINTINKLTEELNSASIIVNDNTAFRVDWMPFAGRKQAGFGIGGIGYTMHEMLEQKMIVIKHTGNVT